MFKASSRRRWYWILFILMGLFVVLGVMAQRRWQRQPTAALYLAVAGPMSGANAANGLEMMRGAQLYLDQVNAAGGVNGQRVELLVFDDQSDPEVARQQAQAIVAQGQVLAVLGHYFSSTSQAAAEIYTQAGLPVISGSATADSLTAEHPGYFRTIFNNHDQGVFLANYMQRVMSYTTAAIVYDADIYGSTLATTFEENFVGLGGHVAHKWQFDPNDDQLEQKLDEIVQQIVTGNHGDDEILFLATHATEAAELVVKLRRRGFTNLIFGGDALAGANLTTRLSHYPEEQAEPGYFSNGIYATTPILYDLAGEETQAFRSAFRESYAEDPNWVAATYYDATQLVVQAMQQAQVRGADLTADRAAIRQQLAQINTPAKALAGVTGTLYFDQQGNSQQAPTIGVFDKGAFTAAAVQLQDVTNLGQVADLPAALAKGDILLVDGKYFYQTDVVYTGIDINEVGNLAADGSSYTVDFYLWFRARPTIDAANIEFLNYAVTRLDSGQRIQLGDPLATKSEHGVVYQAYRLKIDFSSDFDFHAYPFDQQRLAIQFRHVTATRDRLIYVVDQAGLGDVTAPGLLAKLARSGAVASLTDWYPASASFFQNTLSNRSTLGNPQFFAQEADIQYSRFNLVIEIRRNVLNFITRNLLPVFFIILLSYLSFFLPKIDFEALIPILTGTVLSIVFFHLDVSNDLGVSYTVALDYVFYVMYAMFVFQLLLALIAWRVESAGVQKLALGIVRLSYPLIAGCTIVAYLYIYTDFGQSNVSRLWGDTETTAQQLAAPTLPDEAAVTADPDASAAQPELVTLRLGSWRPQDEAAMQSLLADFQQQYPTIQIQVEAGAPETYSSMLERQLEKGVAPDLFYVTAYSAGEELWQSGYLAPLGALPGLTTTFTVTELAPWSSADGVPYGVPWIATIFGVYYNVDRFEELKITPPATWEALLQAAQVIQQAGFTPFANGIQDEWSVNELILMNLAPNFIGGRAGRLAYLAGQRCFNDDHSVAAFQAVADLATFLPTNKADLSYADSQQLFLDGQAAMLLGASWDIPALEAVETPFAWRVFALPAPAGRPTVVTFQPDTAIGLNPASAHPEEARLFLSWLATPEVGERLSQELPGLFVPRGQLPSTPNPHVQAFLALLTKNNTDVGWAWPQISAKLPDAYSLMRQGAVAVIRGEKNAQEAANDLQNGLAQWFQPAQRCLLAK